MPFKANEVTSLPAPMFHALGFLHATIAMMLGTTMVLPDGTVRVMLEGRDERGVERQRFALGLDRRELRLGLGDLPCYTRQLGPTRSDLLDELVARLDQQHPLTCFLRFG